jgi:TorA maturation chaperone TorD
MFELRAIYAAAGLRVADWRCRFDDHLVLQLQYLRHAFATDAVDCAGLADFIDEHLGFWLPDFAGRLAAHGHSPFYAGLAGLTCAWLQALRTLLASRYGRPLPERAEIAARIDRKRVRGRADVAPLRFMPGAQGPSW